MKNRKASEVKKEGTQVQNPNSQKSVLSKRTELPNVSLTEPRGKEVTREAPE
jgi:hypothetical protein